MHELLIDFSYQTKSGSGTLPYYQKFKVANNFTGGITLLGAVLRG